MHQSSQKVLNPLAPGEFQHHESDSVLQQDGLQLLKTQLELAFPAAIANSEGFYLMVHICVGRPQ